jgi:hypothetical protein
MSQLHCEFTLLGMIFSDLNLKGDIQCPCIASAFH